MVGADSRQLIYVPMQGAAPGAGVPAAVGAETVLPAIEAAPEPLRSGTRDPQRGGRQEPVR